MSKYEPLGNYLRAQKSNRVTLSFRDVTDIIGDTLPASATAHVEWWANDTNGQHVQANEWLNAGWKTDSISLADERVTFVRI